MESRINYNKTVFRALLLIIPVSVLVYNYTASKLVSYGLSSLATPMLIFLFVYALWIINQNRKGLVSRELSLLIVFFILCLPAYFTSSFYSLESYIRYFALIAFVPLGFMLGLVWGNLFNSIDLKKRDLLISIFLFPVVIAVTMIANSDILLDEEISRDYVFGIIVFLPLLLYYRNNLLPAVFLIIASIICIISSKRTGMLCVASLIPFLLLIKARTKSARKTIVTSVLVFCFVLFVAYEVLPDISPQIDNAIGRFENINDESSEIRVSMYERTLTGIRQSDLISLFFGHGCLATVELFGHPTHNDWLEITYDYGIFPLICIILLVFSLGSRVVKALKKDLPASLILASTLLIFLITTMGNCLFTNSIAVFILLFTLGFARANLKFHCQL